MEFLVTHTLRTKSCSLTFHLLNEERCVVAEIITAHRTHGNSVVITVEIMSLTMMMMNMMMTIMPMTKMMTIMMTMSCQIINNNITVDKNVKVDVELSPACLWDS